MAKVRAQVSGGSTQLITATTVGEVRKALGLGADYTASVDGEPATDSETLTGEEGDTFVSFAKAVKAG